MSKRSADIVFIIISAAVLILLSKYGLLQKHIGFALIPTLIAYFLGQFVQSRFKNSKED